ncbi:MAG: hypothetical protein OEZ20_04855 [candidate division WOR-3 bacterium]|nr:hypothetical protein [candidate division WOR-3 bacterium]MDH5683773.1 hypothetical protein [candidate division WOR-3 bacterium]
MKSKKFDAVKMMREIRNRLSRSYSKDTEAEKKDLEYIRKKYDFKVKDSRVRPK